MVLQTVEDVKSGRLIVFVRSLTGNKPVADVEVAVLSRKNQLAASGKTDVSGCALLKYDPSWAKESDCTVAVIARKGGDISYFRLQNAKDIERDAEESNPDEPRAFVFAERGIARPGEKITASVFLRQDQNGIYKPMKDTPLTLSVIDPTGNRMFQTFLKSDQYGFARTDFTVPEAAPTGKYTILCAAAGSENACGRGTIRIASYVPDRIKVSGRSLTDKSGIRDTLEFEFDAKYYFGAALENGVYKYSIRSDLSSNPLHWDKSWTVGIPDDFRAADILSGKGKKGADRVRLQYPGFEAQNGRAFNPVRIVAQFEASEPGGRAATGRVRKTLYPTDFFIGLREAECKDGNRTFEYTLLPAEKSDELFIPDDFELTFQLLKKEWEYALVRNSSGRYVREWRLRELPLPDKTFRRVVKAGRYNVGKQELLTWSLASGEYVLTASSGSDYRTRIAFSHYAGDGGERSASPNSIYFRTDAEQVAPGQAFTFHFEAAGDGEAFLVFGEKSLDGYRIVPVKAGKNDVKMTVPSNIHSSSFFVGCTVVVKNNNSYLRNFGLLKMKVDQTKTHRLNVALASPETAEPEAAIPVTVTLKDGAGNPKSGMVCLYAVDSGVISLTGYQAPDIFARFYGAVNCPMDFYDMYGLLFEDLKITPDGRIGGDSAAHKLGKIKQKQTARIIVPSVEIPASGTATVQVRLPDHTGSMDFFAVASSDDAVGSASGTVVIRKPVTVTVSAPRYIAPGDTAELSFTVFNHASNSQEFTCSVTLPPSLKAQGPAVLAGNDLPKGKQRTLTLKIRAGELFESGKITANLTVGQAKAKDDAFITVRAVNVSQSVYRFASLNPGETFKADFDDRYIGKTTGSIRISASPALGIKNALDWLNDYPHGCLEQTTAGAFPFLALSTLEKIGMIDAEIARTNRPKISGAYAKLQAMKLADGSFAMWPAGSETWTEATVFALHFIFEAERRGDLALLPLIRTKHLTWLRKIASDATPEKRAIRAYAAYVLAVAGDSAFLTAARNIVEGAKQPDYALLLAGAALVKGGYASLGTPSVKDALNAKCYREENVPTIYSDNACRLGMALYILMDCAVPDDELPTKLAFELAAMIRLDGSAWGTTQANAWAVLGLTAYAGKYPPTSTQAEILTDGKHENVLISPVKTLPALSGTTVTNRSTGKLIVESIVTGIPRRTPSNGGKLVLSKEYLNEKGEAVRTVRHGDKVYIRIRFESPLDVESIVIADLLPAGLEIEDELLASRAAMIPREMASKYGALAPKRLEKRDDRYLVFGDTAKGKSEFVYQTRAVIRGSFAIPPVHAEAMYQPDITGLFGNMGTLTVK